MTAFSKVPLLLAALLVLAGQAVADEGLERIRADGRSLADLGFRLRQASTKLEFKEGAELDLAVHLHQGLEYAFLVDRLAEFSVTVLGPDGHPVPLQAWSAERENEKTLPHVVRVRPESSGRFVLRIAARTGEDGRRATSTTLGYAYR